MLLLCVLSMSCGSPASPGNGNSNGNPPPNTAKASIAITGVSIQGQKTQTGWQYTILVTAKDSGGVACSVTTLELTFTSNGVAVGTSTPSSSFSGKIPANGSATSRSIAVSDDNAGDPYATHLDTKLTCTDDNQNTVSATGSDNIAALPAPPTIATFTADKTSITTGQSATLQWNVNNATTTSIDNGIGTVGASGSRSVSPSATTTYTVTASNTGGTTTQQLTIAVNAPPPVTPPTVNSFSSDRSNVNIGDSITLSWSTSNATGCSIDNGVGSVATSGSKTITPPGNVIYTLTATNSGGSAAKSVSITTNVGPGFCAANTVPAGTTAVCNDNSTSQSQNRSGTCSSHGGVKCWVCPGVLCNGAPAPETLAAMSQFGRARAFAGLFFPQLLKHPASR